MEALIQLSDLISDHPDRLSDKLSWICTKSPPPGSLRITQQQLNALLALARLLSKSPKLTDPRPKSLILQFLKSIPDSFSPSFWPQSCNKIDSISAFYTDFLDYIVKATELNGDFAEDVAKFIGEILMFVISNNYNDNNNDDAGISRVFLIALSQNCPSVLSSDADRLVSVLLKSFSMVSSKENLLAISDSSGETGSSHSSPYNGKHNNNNNGQVNESESSSSVSISNDEANTNNNNNGSPSSSNVESMRSPSSSVNGGGGSNSNSIVSVDQSLGRNDAAAMIRQQVALFEEEGIEYLEKQAIALRLTGHVVDKVPVRPDQMNEIRLATKKLLQSAPIFLKIRKRDWSEEPAVLRTRIVSKLSVYQAAASVQIKTLASLDSDPKVLKKNTIETLTLFLDVAESCLSFYWRKFRICEELFSFLLKGITKIVITRGGQLIQILFIRLKPLVLTACAQADTMGGSQGTLFSSVIKTSSEIAEFGWSMDQNAVEGFIVGIATHIRERSDYEEHEDKKEKQTIPVKQLNIIRLLADMNVSLNKSLVVDMVLPLFIESLEQGEASTPSILRLQLLNAVSHMASLGFEKSYRETVVLMTRSYTNKLAAVGSVESKTLAPEATTERVETLPAGFLLIAHGLKNPKLRLDYRQRLLTLCSDVGLAAESNSGRSGADFLGPLLPAVAEVCSDLDPTAVVEPALLKLFRNLWFYIALFGLAPPIQKNFLPSKSISTTLNSVGSISGMAFQAVAGPYMYNIQWSEAVQRIAQGTPPLVVSSVKWLEDELELNALHNPGSRRGSGNEKAALVQKAALSAALGGQVEIGAMGAISGVKATYLLAVAFLEIIRFSSNGGILNGDKGSLTSRSAFSCVFEYLKTPNLLPAVTQCLNAIIQSSFETAVSWMGDRVCETGNEAERRELTLSAHACFLIKSMSERDEHIRDISASLLTQLKDRFPQVLWNSSCLDSLLFSVDKDLPPSLVNDPAWVAKVRSLYKRVIQEWITNALSYAPCTSQGLLQEKLCQANAWRTPQSTTDVVSLLSEIRLGSGKTDCWSGIRTANIPAVMAAAGAASGGNFKLVETFNLEVLSTGIVSASYKCNVSGEITGMRGLYNSIGGMGFGLGRGLQMWRSGVAGQEPQAESQSFNALLLAQFVQELQQYVNTAEKGGDVDKSSFRQTCSKATALLLSDLGPDSRPNIEGFSQLLRLLCWCPAYISTPDAMETGVYIWTWLVSAAPQLGSLVLAELVDAWLWTIDTKRGLFAHEMKFSGPAAKLRPHLAPGEPELPPDKDPVEGIIAHRLWLGFFIDRFEVTRHGSVEHLMLLGRLLQGTMKLHSHFSRHPAASGTFFTVMLLGLKFCSCQSQANLQDFRMGLQLLEDRVFRASLGWFANEPEWYDRNNRTFALHEAQSMSLFIHFLQNEHTDVIKSDSLPKGRENGGSFQDLKDQYHPVWGKMDNYAVGREKRKQLLLMLCQHQADRLDVWANPTTAKENTLYKLKFNTEKWVEYARTAFSVDPRIALSLVSRFPAVSTLRAEITQLVQTHITEIRHIPEALPFFVTPKAVEENSPILQQLPHWAACSITQALQFLTPAYKGHLRVMAYVLRVLESYPPVSVKEYMPQLVQALRYDDEGLVEGYLLRAANRSDIFAHILIWNLQGETSGPEEGKDTSNGKNSLFQSKLPAVRQRIVDGFSQKALDIFEREFDFFDKVTSISGVLFPLPKEERRAGIRRELEKIEVNGDDLYLPTASNKLVRGIRLDSGIPLQSAAKVPIMITFNVMDRGGSEDDIKPQACIFKVGDDCRQDVLALQVISLLRDIFEAVGINLYLFPYGVLPTGPERGIIEVVPNTRSRSQMGEINDGGLYEIFQQDFGSVGSPTFEAARDNFIISSAGYAVASLLLQPKDRHNGNLLFDNVGRLVHIDFGFILETSPGGNMRFESAHFKLSHEMTQLLDPSGAMKSETWMHFTSLCVKGYLAARLHMDGIINTVQLMVDSGLPCFGRGDPIGNLRKRFHPEMSEREAAIFMIRICTDAYNKWTTAGYDLIQYLQQGIEK